MANNSCEEILACLSANGLTVGRTGSVPEEIRGYDDAGLWALATAIGLSQAPTPWGIAAAAVAAFYGGNKERIWDGLASLRDTVNPSMLQLEMIAAANIRLLPITFGLDFVRRLYDLQGMQGGYLFDANASDLKNVIKAITKDDWISGLIREQTQNLPPGYEGSDWQAQDRALTLMDIQAVYSLTESQALEVYNAVAQHIQGDDLDNSKNPTGQAFRRIVQAELQGGKDGNGVRPQIEKVKEKAAKTDEKLETTNRKTLENTAQTRKVQGELDALRAKVVLLEQTINSRDPLYRAAAHNQSQPHAGQPVATAE